VSKAGRRFVFHGAFTSKKDAQRKEGSIRGSFIRIVRMKGGRRFVVMSEKRQA